MGHSHDLDVSAPIMRVLASVAAVVAVATLAAMLVLGFGTDTAVEVEGILVTDTYTAQVTDAREAPCSGTTDDDGVRCRVVTFTLSAGPDQGLERTQEFPVDAPASVDLRTGDRIVVSYSAGAEQGYEYQFADRQRRPVLWALALVFAIAVVLLGRMRGLAALAGLVASLVIVLQFVLPNILDGHSPVLVAVIGATAIAYLALYLAHGFNAMTTVALLGTLASLALTVVLSWVFTEVARFSGYASEEAQFLGLLAGRVDVGGLVLGGIVIGALGALDDMTVTQAAAVAELRRADPTMSRRRLYAAGLRIGRDHVASTVNTLALAYAGAALPLLLLFVLSGQSLGTVANSEDVAIEIVRTLVGSIGLVASVPITTWLAAHVSGTATPEPEAGRRPGRPNRRSRVLFTLRRSGDGPVRRRAADGPRTPITPDPGDASERSFWS